MTDPLLDHGEDACRYKLAIEEYKREKYERAREMLLELEGKYPEDARVLGYLGCCHDVLGFPSEALEYFERAANQAPMEEWWSIGLFHCLWDKGDWNAAFQEAKRFRRASQASPLYDELIRDMYDEFEAKGGFAAEAEAKRTAASLGLGPHVLTEPPFGTPLDLRDWAIVRSGFDSATPSGWVRRRDQAELHEVRWAPAIEDPFDREDVGVAPDHLPQFRYSHVARECDRVCCGKYTEQSRARHYRRSGDQH